MRIQVAMPSGLIATYLLLIALAIPWAWSYIQPGLGVTMAVMVLPFVWRVEKAHPRSRYGWIAVALWSLHLMMGNYLWLWLAFGCALLFAVEWPGGRVGWIPMFLIGLLSPVMGSWVQAFSFPLRITLSQGVAKTLGTLGLDIEVIGNRFSLDGQWFEVEAACLGISTLTLAWAGTILLLGLAERHRQQHWSLLQIILWLCLATGLAVFANYLRTLCLVLFHSPPATLGHELIGLLSIVLIVGIPMWLLLREPPEIDRGYDEEEKDEPNHQSLKPSLTRLNWKASLPSLVLTLVSLTSLWAFFRPESPLPSEMAHFQITSLERDLPQPKVLRFQDAEKLLYLKAPVPAWRADHSPQVCWRGSGYRFAQIQETERGGIPAMQALLIQRGDTLFTAWGYHNGYTSVVGPLTWRMQQLQGEPGFYLWNATAAKEAELESLIALFAEEIALIKKEESRNNRIATDP